MRTRTFLGLIFLIAALLVVSTPQLLEPTARGVEKLAVKAGVVKPGGGKDSSRPERTGKGGDAIESRLLLKGYEDQNGDLRDTTALGARANQRNRLVAGESRLTTPGSRTRDQYNPPVASEDGVLLDITGCPVFPANADIASLMADPATKQTYANKAASSDNPAPCRAALDAAVNAAIAPVGIALPGDRRQLASSVRSDSQRLMFDLYAGGLYEDLFEGWIDAPDTAADIKQELAPTP